MIGPKVRVILRRMSLVDDKAGGSTTSWSDLCYIEGSLSRARGNRRLAHGTREIESTHVFNYDQPLQYVPTESDTLKMGLRAFEIVYVDNVMEQGRNYMLYLVEVEAK